MQEDTVNLLKECNAGIKMGKDAIDKVLPHVKSKELHHTLKVCQNTHAALGDETHALLLRQGADTRMVHPVARAMSNMKIQTAMITQKSDKTIANLMTDGCDMGIKSLHGYLNKYKNADDKAKNLARRLIASEEYLENNLKKYL